MENWACSTKPGRRLDAVRVLCRYIEIFSFGFLSGTSVRVLTDNCKEYWDKEVKSNRNQYLKENNR
jgi:hypothetical protein